MPRGAAAHEPHSRQQSLTWVAIPALLTLTKTAHARSKNRLLFNSLAKMQGRKQKAANVEPEKGISWLITFSLPRPRFLSPPVSFNQWLQLPWQVGTAEGRSTPSFSLAGTQSAHSIHGFAACHWCLFPSWPFSLSFAAALPSSFLKALVCGFLSLSLTLIRLQLHCPVLKMWWAKYHGGTSWWKEGAERQRWKAERGGGGGRG